MKKSTYISINIDPNLTVQMIELLKEFKDCFAWDYDEMTDLNRDLVELQLPIQPDKKPMKQTPKIFAP